MAGQSKLWYKSKTIWFAVLVNAAIAGWNQLSPELELSADRVALVNTLLALILRKVTTGPVTLTSPKNVSSHGKL